MGEGCPSPSGIPGPSLPPTCPPPPHARPHLALDVEDEDGRGGHGGGRRTGSREGGRETTAAPLPSSCGSAGAGERSGERVLKGRPPGERSCPRTRSPGGKERSRTPEEPDSYRASLSLRTQECGRVETQDSRPSVRPPFTHASQTQYSRDFVLFMFVFPVPSTGCSMFVQIINSFPRLYKK